MKSQIPYNSYHTNFKNFKEDYWIMVLVDGYVSSFETWQSYAGITSYDFIFDFEADMRRREFLMMTTWGIFWNWKYQNREKQKKM